MHQNAGEKNVGKCIFARALSACPSSNLRHPRKKTRHLLATCAKGNVEGNHYWSLGKCWNTNACSLARARNWKEHMLLLLHWGYPHIRLTAFSAFLHVEFTQVHSDFNCSLFNTHHNWLTLLHSRSFPLYECTDGQQDAQNQFFNFALRACLRVESATPKWLQDRSIRCLCLRKDMFVID